MFSIIIPTLQKNLKVLTMLIDELVKDSVVGEVIVIDNSLQGFEYKSDKVRVIIPEENLFVNPSWNLGVREAKYDFVGILNDDILIPENLCSDVFSFLQNASVGLVGVDTESIEVFSSDSRLKYPKSCQNITYTNQENVLYIGYWGIAIFAKKSNYYEIPEDIKIWCGDNYLVKMNEDSGRQNYKIHCGKIFHIGSLSSKSSTYDSIKRNDVDLYSKIDERFIDHDRGVKMPKYHFGEYIFSIKNTVNRSHKVITILGIRLSIKRGNK